MSNIIEGDSVKNFGEFIPNPYIEKITVTEVETNIVNLNIEYSLLFLVCDQFDIEDVVNLFYDNTINIYGLIEATVVNSPSTKQDLVSLIHNENIDDTKPIRTNAQDKRGFIKIFGSEGLVLLAKAAAISCKLFHFILRHSSTQITLETFKVVKGKQ